MKCLNFSKYGKNQIKKKSRTRTTKNRVIWFWPHKIIELVHRLPVRDWIKWPQNQRFICIWTRKHLCHGWRNWGSEEGGDPVSHTVSLWQGQVQNRGLLISPVFPFSCATSYLEKKCRHANFSDSSHRLARGSPDIKLTALLIIQTPRHGLN